MTTQKGKLIEAFIQNIAEGKLSSVIEHITEVSSGL